MNSDNQEGKGGASIIPSARKGIHSFRDSEMGQYGLHKSNNRNNRASSLLNEQGKDEVDNVMSKMARQTSPLSIRKKKVHRTNSYPQEEETTDTSDVHSHSLPSTLPSHLYCSDDTDYDEPHYSSASLSKSRLDDSNHSQLLNRSNQSSDHLNSSPYQRKLSIASPPRNVKEPKSNKIYITILTIAIGIIAAIYSTYPMLVNHEVYSKHHKSTQTVNYDELLFTNNLNVLQKKYNVDSNSILKLKTGISSIFSKMDAGSFMFVYNSETINFNPSQFDNFINEVAYTAARYLRNNISSIKHTVVLSSSLDMVEHGELINRYRDDVDKSGVLLVKEVDSIPSNLAMAFHYYCDEYDPLVKRSAIFFTLNLANCSNAREKKSTHDFIEKCLAGKWNTVPSENMRPLLTRVVDIIIDVTSVF